MRRRWASGFWLAVGLTVLAPGLSAQEGEACLRDVAQHGIDEATVLDPDLDPENRQAALKRIIARARDGEHGSAAYLLGALYRLGKAHPAALVERDPETARYWFGRCVASEGCPEEVFAAMAELELVEDRPHEALVYTQVYLNLLRLAEPRETSFYDLSLLERVRARHGRVDPERLQAGVDAYVAEHGHDLQRILAGMRKPDGLVCDGALEVGYDYAGRAPRRPGRTRTKPGVYAWYLAALAQEPGYPDKALLYDALPDAEQARGLERNVRTLRMKASVAPPVGERWWFVVPITVSASGIKPVLIEQKMPAGRDEAESDAGGGGTDE